MRETSDAEPATCVAVPDGVHSGDPPVAILREVVLAESDTVICAGVEAVAADDPNDTASTPCDAAACVSHNGGQSKCTKYIRTGIARNAPSHAPQPLKQTMSIKNVAKLFTILFS